MGGACQEDMGPTTLSYIVQLGTDKPRWTVQVRRNPKLRTSVEVEDSQNTKGGHDAIDSNMVDLHMTIEELEALNFDRVTGQ